MLAISIEQYNESKGKKIAYISSSSFLMILILFAYFTTFYIQNAVPADVPPIKSDEVIEEFIVENVEIKDIGGSAGGGTPTNDKVAPPAVQSEKFVTGNQSSDKIFSGNSNNQNGKNATNGSSTSTKGNNPFANGGSGGGTGSGNGPFGGQGDGDIGNGPSGAGSGSGKARIRLNDVTLPKYDTDFDSKIYLKLSINSNGDVFAATCIKSITTCTDQRIINQVISEVIRQVKYKKDPGSGTVYTNYSVQINAK
jgi:hypothetical protein